MRFFISFLFIALSACVTAAVIDDDIEIQGHLIELGMGADGGGTLQNFGLLATPTNFAGAEGLLQEGFGVGNFYVPNRRLNEKMEALDSVADRPVLQYSYDCDGPNIQGLKVVRRLELLPDESSVRVTWTVTNGGNERQWVTPWVRNDVTPGGSVSDRDRLDLPSTSGIVQPTLKAYYPATRNWIGFTDPIEQESLYAVFDAEHTYAFLAEPFVTPTEAQPTARMGVQTAFVPFLLEPGASWETRYRLNMVRGLKHIDFATDEFATQIDYDDGTLSLLFSPVKEMSDLQINAKVKAADGTIWDLPEKKFSLAPNRLARCTFDWKAPASGAYEILAQITQRGKVVALGSETSSPHGGIDTQFIVGKPVNTRFAAWSDAPHVLDQQSRTVKRSRLSGGDVALWAETSLHKVLPQDQLARTESIDPVIEIAAAQGESESFQIALRPPRGRDLKGVTVVANDLLSTRGARIPAEAVSIYVEQYQRIVISSHFEGPTGAWPDALLPLTSMDAPGGQTSPIWFTITVPTEAPAGIYSGLVEIQGGGLPPVEVFLEVEVFGFKLPSRPMFNTDFVLDIDLARQQHKQTGGSLSDRELLDRFQKNGAAHRVTLRGPIEFPEEQANYGSALAAFKTKLDAADPAGVTTISVPPSLVAYPDQLSQANAFVKKNGLESRVFSQVANEPARPAWPRLLEGMQQWKDAAPEIPIMVTTYGLEPFLPDGLDRWAVHAPIFDTANNAQILERIRAGREVWWYVDQTPPRPYGNFFVDFEAIEHRILFWQSWALGVRGMHYWSVNTPPAGRNPWLSLLDVTPVNGDGFLIYTDKNGPVNSIRWESIRDGIEDYDYLAIFNDRRRKLLDTPGHEALLQRAAKVYNLGEVIPSLVDFTRDPQVLLEKRRAIANMIVEMNTALGK